MHPYMGVWVELVGLPGEEGLSTGRIALHGPWEVHIVLNIGNFLSKGPREASRRVNLFTNREVFHDPTLGKHFPCTNSMELLLGNIHGRVTLNDP